MRSAVRALLFFALMAAAVAGQQAPAGEPSVKLPPELARVLTDYEVAWWDTSSAGTRGSQVSRTTGNSP